MKTYFIADTHFNHSNIIKYCDRPFTGVQDMNTAIIEEWNNVVKKDDIVYHLGDFAFANFKEVSDFRQQLNGKIFLVLGNHDTYNVKKYYEAGFDKVYDKPILFNEYFLLSHQPLFLPDKLPYANIYGHVHNDSRYQTCTENSFCVSIERLGYQPINFVELQRRMKNVRTE